MKHATQLAFASVAAFALSAQAGKVKTFDIDFSESGFSVGSKPTGAIADGKWSGDASGDSKIATTNSNPYLLLDTESNAPLTFEPNASNETVSVQMDVKFVPATSAQDPVLNTQVGIYSLNGALKVSVNGGSFGDAGIAVSADTWYTVKLDFDYTAGSKSVVVAIYNGNSLVGSTNCTTSTTATHLNGIDFYGSGSIDNFVGSYALDSATDTDTGTAGDTASDTDMTIANGVLTTQFASTAAGGNLKFITVTGKDSSNNTITRTLRVVNGNQDIAINDAGFSSVSKVVAYYGNNVTATTGNAPAVTTTSVAANGTVTGSVVAKSGLYYAKEENGVKTALNNNNPIAPQAEGTTLEFTVAPSSASYGVKKFKIVASDDPVSAQ